MRADQITLHRAHSIDQIFQSRLLYNLDSRHYPKNEVNFRISGTVLDSAIQDSCKYSTYIHVSMTRKMPRFNDELARSRVSDLCNQNEKFRRSL